MVDLERQAEFSQREVRGEGVQEEGRHRGGEGLGMLLELQSLQ